MGTEKKDKSYLNDPESIPTSPRDIKDKIARAFTPVEIQRVAVDTVIMGEKILEELRNSDEVDEEFKLKPTSIWGVKIITSPKLSPYYVKAFGIDDEDYLNYL